MQTEETKLSFPFLSSFSYTLHSSSYPHPLQLALRGPEIINPFWKLNLFREVAQKSTGAPALPRVKAEPVFENASEDVETLSKHFPYFNGTPAFLP